MKIFMHLIYALLLLFVVGIVAPVTSFAAADATCVADPPRGPVGTRFVITCTGFTPMRYVYAYVVEPSGAARQLPQGNGSIKISDRGTLSFTQSSLLVTDAHTHVGLGTGTWQFVAEELGLGRTVIHRGQVGFTITGGIEGVSGATLTVSPALVHKPLQGFKTVIDSSDEINHPPNDSAIATLTGTGFAPMERVTIWLEPPHGSCASMTQHDQGTDGFDSSDGYHSDAIDNFNIQDGIGTRDIGTFTADHVGGFSLQFPAEAPYCEGVWHFVARGNASQRGGDTFLTIVGNAITTNATLSANPGTVSAMYGHVEFHGSGFGSQEIVACWLVTPQGQTFSYPYPDFESSDTFYFKNKVFRADVAGNVALEMYTGSNFVLDSFIPRDNTPPLEFSYEQPIQSEGALGIYAMTCRGVKSGATAIARFTVTGGAVDP